MSKAIEVELLWNCAKALKGEQQTHKLLRSYYINTCWRLAKNNLQVPKEKFALSQICPYCGSFWNESNFQLKSVPKQLKLSSKEKKLIENYDKCDGSAKTLSKTQKNRAKWLKKRQFKRLAIKCQQCSHRSFVKMEHKKRKLQTTHPLKNEKNAKTPIVVKKPDKYVKCTSTKKHNHGMAYLQQKSQKSKLNENQKKSIKNNNKMKANTSSTNKVISNTQKQNSLLQLAALIQKKTNDDTKNSPEKKLQKLLR